MNEIKKQRYTLFLFCKLFSYICNMKKLPVVLAVIINIVILTISLPFIGLLWLLGANNIYNRVNNAYWDSLK